MLKALNLEPANEVVAGNVTPEAVTTADGEADAVLLSAAPRGPARHRGAQRAERWLHGRRRRRRHRPNDGELIQTICDPLDIPENGRA